MTIGTWLHSVGTVDGHASASQNPADVQMIYSVRTADGVASASQSLVTTVYSIGTAGTHSSRITESWLRFGMTINYQRLGPQ